MKHIVGFFILFFSTLSLAAPGLVVHTTELGVAKFHRYDNKVHPYGSDNVWTPFILPDNAGTDKNLVQKNADGSYTVFFLTLEDMIVSVIQLSKQQNQPVALLSVHGHGLPGAMWFPRDMKDYNSLMCYQWKDAANGDDEGNYDQYYSPVSASQVRQIRSMGERTSNQMGCTVGLSEWETVVGRHPEFKTVLSNEAQLSFLSCVVGLGKAGENFTQGLAKFLFPNGSAGKIQTSVNFGLGDWSMTRGMGFWDYISDSQLQRDNANYPKNRRDSEMAQKGTVRVATFNSGNWVSSLIGNQDVMIFSEMTNPQGPRIFETRGAAPADSFPMQVRIPGTNTIIEVR